MALTAVALERRLGERLDGARAADARARARADHSTAALAWLATRQLRRLRRDDTGGSEAGMLRGLAWRRGSVAPRSAPDDADLPPEIVWARALVSGRAVGLISVRASARPRGESRRGCGRASAGGDDRASAGDQASRRAGVGEQADDGQASAYGVVGLDDQRRALVSSSSGIAPTLVTTAGLPAIGGLERDPAEGLVEAGRIDDHVGGRVDVGDVLEVAGDVTESASPSSAISAIRDARDRRRPAGAGTGRRRARSEPRAARSRIRGIARTSTSWPRPSVTVADRAPARGASGGIEKRLAKRARVALRVTLAHRRVDGLDPRLRPR